MESLINELFQLQLQLYPENKPHLNPPASEEQILSLEEKLGFLLPLSYRNFLKIHNGWKNFGELNLFGTDDFFSQWTNEQRDHYINVDAGTPFELGAIPIVMGEAEFINHFWALDPKSKHGDGEMDIVDWDYGHEEKRFSSFLSFLENQIALEKTRLQRALE